MVTRTFACLNIYCQAEFDSSAEEPPCPICDGPRCKWMPKPFGILAKAPGVDATVRDLADSMGMTNFKSPVAGEPAVVRAAPMGPPDKDLSYQPANGQGWGVNLPRDCFQGQGRAYCAPTGVTAKLNNRDFNFVGQPQPVTEKRLGAASEIQASWRPEGGIPRD